MTIKEAGDKLVEVPACKTILVYCQWFSAGVLRLWSSQTQQYCSTSAASQFDTQHHNCVADSGTSVEVTVRISAIVMLLAVKQQ